MLCFRRCRIRQQPSGRRDRAPRHAARSRADTVREGGNDRRASDVACWAARPCWRPRRFSCRPRRTPVTRSRRSATALTWWTSSAPPAMPRCALPTSDEFSDGSGIDTLTMSGGAVLATGRGHAAGGWRCQSRPQAPASSTCSAAMTSSPYRAARSAAPRTPIGIVLGAGADTFRMSGGTITGSVFGLGGGNIYAVSGGTIDGSLFAGSQNDVVVISGTANIQRDAAIGPDSVGLEDGNDRFTMTGGTLAGAVSGGNGNDVLTVSGGTIGAYIAGNDGVDRISIFGGTIAGDVDAETVILGGGTIGGDIAGISSTTLVINDTDLARPDQPAQRRADQRRQRRRHHHQHRSRRRRNQDAVLRRLRQRRGRQFDAGLRQRHHRHRRAEPRERLDAVRQRQRQSGRLRHRDQLGHHHDRRRRRRRLHARRPDAQQRSARLRRQPADASRRTGSSPPR